MKRNVTVKEAIDLYNETKEAFDVAEEVGKFLYSKMKNFREHQIITTTQVLKLYISEIETYACNKISNESNKFKDES